MAELKKIYCEFPHKNGSLCCEPVEYLYSERGAQGWLCREHKELICSNKKEQNIYAQLIFDRYLKYGNF